VCHKLSTIILAGCLFLSSGCTPDSDDVVSWHQDYESGKKSKARTVELLIDALKNGKEGARYNAAVYLGRIGDPQAVEPLLGELQSFRDPFRKGPIIALGKIGDRRATEALIAILNQETADDPFGEEVVQEAVDALGEIRDLRAVEPLIAQLGKERLAVNVDKHIAIALGKCGDRKAVEPLVKLLEDRHTPRIESFQPTGGGMMIKYATNVSADQLWEIEAREAAAWALGKIGDPRSIESLMTALEHAKSDQMEYRSEMGDNVEDAIKAYGKLQEQIEEALGNIGAQELETVDGGAD